MGPYELLGVEPGATELEVRRAHRELVRVLRPAEPSQLRDLVDRRLQLVDEAREQVLADIRRRPGVPQGSAAPVGRQAGGHVVPLQRSNPDDVGAHQRWAEHQDWLHGLEMREEERRRQRRRALFLAPFVLVLTLDLALGLGMILGTGILT